MKPFKALLSHLGFIVAPLIFGLYPILFLYAGNIQEVPLNLLVKPVLLVLGGTFVGLILFGLAYRSREKAGLVMVVFWMLFFSYGHFFIYADNRLTGLGRHRYLLAGWVLMFMVAMFIAWRIHESKTKLVHAALFMGMVLVSLQVVGIAKYAVGTGAPNSYDFLVNNEERKLSPQANAQLPNVYYIMPDSYPHSGTLKSHFNFDNSEFTNFLTAKGFHVAEQSYANYNQTALSVPATLNMSYLKDLKTTSLSTTDLTSLYHNNKALNYLRAGGYKFINNSNLYSTQANPVADLNVNCGRTNEFLKELTDTTVLRPFKLISNNTRKNKRADALCVMDNISGPNTLAEPKFVFTHLMPPHPPYIFGVNGEDVTKEANLSLTVTDRWRAKQPYVNQLRFVNKRISAEVEEILKASPNSIIIIQSDHGTLSGAADPRDPLRDMRPVVLEERGRTFFAIYLPASCDQSQADSYLTNVNAFRIAFNSCFGAGYELLEDRIYYVNSGAGSFKNFTDITDRLPIIKPQ